MTSERFLDKVELIPFHSCYEWVGGKNPDGYGRWKISNKVYGAHRLSYEIFIGPIPKGFHVLHNCDNPGCVRPEHLSLGTMSDNIKDCVKRGRHHWANKSKCSMGHAYTDSNTKSYNGKRKCLTCNRERQRKWYWSQKC